jgi:hypothetical protein
MSTEYLRTALTDLADVYHPEVVLAEARHLFDVVPSSPSRAGDRDTATAAGNSRASRDVGRFSSTSTKAALLFAIRRAHDRLGGLTAQDAARRVLPDTASLSAMEGARRRVSDLAACGFIEDSGERRANEGSKDEAIVWRITDVGRMALVSLETDGWTRGRAA